MLFEKRIFIILPLFLTGCYGTFRTARSVPEGKWNIQIAWTVLETEYKVWDYYESPFICIRKGYTKRSDVGLKLYIPGFQIVMFNTFLKEGKFTPSIGLEAGIGYPILYDVHLILSKEIFIFTPYFSYKIVGFPSPLIYGANAGICVNFFKRFNLYFEYYYGQIFIPSPPAFDAPPPKNYKGSGIGVSLGFLF